MVIFFRVELTHGYGEVMAIGILIGLLVLILSDSIRPYIITVRLIKYPKICPISFGYFLSLKIYIGVMTLSQLLGCILVSIKINMPTKRFLREFGIGVPIRLLYTRHIQDLPMSCCKY